MTIGDIALLFIAIGVFLPRYASLFKIEEELRTMNSHLQQIAYELKVGKNE